MCLGKLSRPMAGLPEQKDEVMVDAPAEEGTPAAEKSEAAATATTTAAPAAQQAPATGGGKGKKKKGKK